MADCKPYLKKVGVIKSVVLTIPLGALCVQTLIGGSADGQAPEGQPRPAPTAAAIPALPPALEPPPPAAVMPPMARKMMHFDIKPDTPLKDLLPTPPTAKTKAGANFIDDISQVPEVAFQKPLAKTQDALRLTAHTMAKINHLNQKKADGFMEALLASRPDLAGLPMAMGETCRTKGDRAQFFTHALNNIKRAKGQGNMVVGTLNNQILLREPTARKAPIEIKEPVVPPAPQATPPASGSPGPVANLGAGPPLVIDGSGTTTMFLTSVALAPQKIDPDKFWAEFANLCAQEDKANNALDPAQLDHVITARIAALMQVLAPDSVAMRRGLVKYLASTSHAEATRALAKLAIFSAEDEVRNPAVEALKVRREKDYTEILLSGLRYPLPAVAKRAAEAMAKLERADMVPELVSFLAEPDPRAPIMKDVGEKKVPIVRELVRINHHRNCLMCHAPAVPGEVPQQVTTAEVPRPDQPLPSPFDGYSNSIPEILVRLDVTYLRQDFSLMQPVADANPWPEMQRFDFMVRSRALTDQEAKGFPAAKTGELSPYQRVTLAALREITRKDAAPTAEAWRQLLALPERRK